MPDVIKLLPDAVANQIAAGEVVQRPASAVKELLENAIDAGANQIQLIVKDAGKTLIQVVDNGKGMSEKDALLCVERHATSKISKAQDLFKIRTMGFRGEALASMAAISKVEIKTKSPKSQLGTRVCVEASRMETNEACNCSDGTSIAVKNLFFNTPARRNFLKSDPVENKHILQEFQRIAIAYPSIEFKLFQNNHLTHHLTTGNLKQRIALVFGNNYKQRLVPVDEKTDLLQVSGFVGKPEYAKKSRGEQFFFVNQRFIRSSYLNHAVLSAFEELIPDGNHPSYFLFLIIPPEQIDVNVHPTKTEIKFQDERYVYQIIKASVKKALGNHNLTPSLDFERETAFPDAPSDPNKPIRPPSISINPDYNPFQTKGNTGSAPGNRLTGKGNPARWETIFPSASDIANLAEDPSSQQTTIAPNWDTPSQTDEKQKFFQLHNQYILTPVKSGLMIIDQQCAHERILFEKYSKIGESGSTASQQLLFPENIRLGAHDADILTEIMEEVKNLGFGISQLSGSTFVVDAVPVDFRETDSLIEVMEEIIENHQVNKSLLNQDTRTSVIRSLAKRMGIVRGKPMQEEEMSALVDALFACEVPQLSPSGKQVLHILSMDKLAGLFK